VSLSAVSLGALTLVAALLVALLLAVWWRSVQQRRAQLNAPFPDGWRSALETRVPLYRAMPASVRDRVEPVARRLLARTAFIGCNGLAVTEAMRREVAVQAAVLVAFRDVHAFDPLYSVLLYPSGFVVEERDEDEFGLVTEGRQELSGQAIDTSRIVLSWEDVEEGLAGHDGYNVVIHEFAHYLDHLADGALTEGASPSGGALAGWHEILEREHRALCAAVDRGDETLIDPYGAEDLAEFFATASEVFFLRAREFSTAHRALHAELVRFYGVDPAAWG
jgi:hypothetical protein